MDSTLSNTTRYLCAAAHLDASFRNQVIEQLLDQHYRAVAPSWGVDLKVVVVHCLDARRRAAFRDILLFCMFAALILFALAPVPYLFDTWA